MNMIITKTKDPKYKELYKDSHFVVYERLQDVENEQSNQEEQNVQSE